MPRSNSPRRRGRPAGPGPGQPAPLDLDRALAGVDRRESGPDGTWVVRRVSGSAAGRAYRCPGCDQEVLAATPHVVAWPADSLLGDGVEHRRHWHGPCWSARGRRRPR